MKALLLLVFIAICVECSVGTKTYKPGGFIQGLCGTWKLGVPPSHPECRPITTGGVGLHYEQDISGHASLGPSVHGASEVISFPNSNDNSFVYTTTLWSDAPCFTRKPTCSFGKAHWDPKAGKCVDEKGLPTKWQTCPSYQKRLGQEKACGKVPGKGKCAYCYPITRQCTCGCMDEEFYPGCGALKAKDGGGVKLETITMKGKYVSVFDQGNKKLVHKDTCTVLCPCKSPRADCDYDLPGYKGYQVDKCTATDYAAYMECKGTPPVPGAFDAASSNAWRNFYSSEDVMQLSKPVVLVVDEIRILGHAKEQIAYLEQQCKCTKSLKAGKDKSYDISKCTVDTCPYLAAKGLFSVVPDVNCPTGKKCLFASVYVKEDNRYMYMSRAQPTLAQVVKSPIYSDGVYTRQGMPCVSAASSLHQSATISMALLMGALFMMWQ